MDWNLKPVYCRADTQPIDCQKVDFIEIIAVMAFLKPLQVAQDMDMSRI